MSEALYEEIIENENLMSLEIDNEWKQLPFAGPHNKYRSIDADTMEMDAGRGIVVPFPARFLQKLITKKNSWNVQFHVEYKPLVYGRSYKTPNEKKVKITFAKFIKDETERERQEIEDAKENGLHKLPNGSFENKWKYVDDAKSIIALYVDQGISTTFNTVHYDKIVALGAHWYSKIAKYTTYIYGKVYAKETRKSIYYLLHRVILGLKPGDGIEVDHANGLGTDNTDSNISSGSKDDNMNNRKMFKNNTSGVNGISIRPAEKKRASRVVAFWTNAEGKEKQQSWSFAGKRNLRTFEEAWDLADTRRKEAEEEVNCINGKRAKYGPHTLLVESDEDEDVQ